MPTKDEISDGEMENGASFIGRKEKGKATSRPLSAGGRDVYGIDVSLVFVRDGYTAIIEALDDRERLHSYAFFLQG